MTDAGIVRRCFCFGICLAAPALTACDLCSVYNAPLAHGIIDQGFHVSVAEQFTHFGSLQFESKPVHNPAHQFLDSSVTQLALGYNFNDQFGINFHAPLIHRSFRRAEGGAVEEGTESGLGDVGLSASYLLFHRDTERTSFSSRVQAGIKFPTGDTDRLKEELEEETPVPGEVESAVHGHDLALGSGSYDAFFGAQVFGRWRRWFATAETQYAVRTEGDFGYHYANDLTWSGGPGYYVAFEETFTLALEFEVSGESKGRDEFRGESAVDTAVTSVYLGPRLSMSWHGRLSAELALGLPVDIQNSALQAVPDYRVQAGLLWKF